MNQSAEDVNDNLYLRALHLYRKRDSLDCIDYLESRSEMSFRDFRLLLLSGHCYRRIGQWSSARRAYERAEEQQPNCLLAAQSASVMRLAEFTLARNSRNKGNKAIDQLTQEVIDSTAKLTHLPSSALDDWKFCLIACHFACLGEFTDAIENCLHCLRIKPYNIVALHTGAFAADKLSDKALQQRLLSAIGTIHPSFNSASCFINNSLLKAYPYNVPFMA